jgi:hypothetical protein
MPRPADLPPEKHYEHGTRARYVAGCRCRACKDANVRAYHEREAAAKEAALELGDQPTKPAPKTWRAPDGTRKVRVYRRACPGVNGERCKWGSHLRKDSTGGICARCRKRLVWNGLVDAKAARDHLAALSGLGVGYKSVADAASVSRSVVGKIRSGEKRSIRASTERRLLAVDHEAVADHGLVDARPVWRMIGRLRKFHGFSKAEIARRLGMKRPALQLGKRKVLAKTALKVARLLRDADGDFLGRGQSCDSQE